MMDPKHVAQTLTGYWHEGLWQTFFNMQPLLASQLAKGKQCSRDDILQGKVSSTLLTTECTPVWVAPLVFCKQETMEYWIPLWLPAQLNQQQLELRDDHALPWVPADQFDVYQQGPFSAERSVVDDWLRFDFLMPDNQIAFDNWPDYLQGCIEALDGFSEQPWQAALSDKGFHLSESAYVFDAAILCPPISTTMLSPVLKQYCNLAENEKITLQDEEAWFENTPFLCGAMSEITAHSSTYHAILQILALQSELLLAVQAPIGSDKQTLLSALIASTVVQHTLTKQYLPKIAVLTPQPVYYEQLYSTLNVEQAPLSFEALKQLYAEYMQGLVMVNRLLTEEANDSLLEDLQQQDESLEKVLHELFAKQDALKPKSHLRRYLSLLLPDKQKAATLLALSEQIRQCKTKRTKIHQAIVRVVELINEKRKNENAWHAWCQRLLPGMATDFQAAQFAISHRLFAMTLAYWQQQDKAKAKEWFVINPSDAEAFDVLIVEQAHRYLPQQVAPYLNQAKRAIFIGDSQEQEAMPAISSLAEERALAKHQLHDEDIIEQMHYKGMLQSIGNAFHVAITNSNVAPCKLPSCVLYHPAIGQFLRERSISPAVPHEVEREGLHLLDRPGLCEKHGNEYVNVLQAQAVVAWLLQGPLLAKHASVQIVTPFQAQQQILSKELLAAGITCPVYRCCDLPNEVSEYVIFVSVMTLGAQRPFIFDRGEQHFYRMIVRASRGFWIIGDQRIFDPKTHSPSGQLAKLILGKVKQSLSVA